MIQLEVDIKMLSLYIVRHGQTQYNLKRLVQGWCNSDLTEEGINQAIQVGIGLKDIPFKACVCSDLDRTVQTAKLIIGDRDIPIHKTWKLREMHFGSYEETSIEEFFKIKPHPVRKGLTDAGGENLEILTERLLDGINEIKDQFMDGTILVVSHGRAITTLLEAISKEIFTDIVDNCSVSILDYNDNQWVIREMNNTSYRK